MEYCTESSISCMQSAQQTELSRQRTTKQHVILKTLEDDRARWWNYVVQGKVPAWMYFVKFEGMTEQEAKAMIEEAQEQNKPDSGLYEE